MKELPKSAWDTNATIQLNIPKIAGDTNLKIQSIELSPSLVPEKSSRIAELHRYHDICEGPAGARRRQIYRKSRGSKRHFQKITIWYDFHSMQSPKIIRKVSPNNKAAITLW